jgi:hypothetical protein
MCFEKLIGFPFRMLGPGLRLQGTNGTFKVDLNFKHKMPTIAGLKRKVREHQLAG